MDGYYHLFSMVVLITSDVIYFLPPVEYCCRCFPVSLDEGEVLPIGLNPKSGLFSQIVNWHFPLG